VGAVTPIPTLSCAKQQIEINRIDNRLSGLRYLITEVLKDDKY
jgi:hypothetical protein